MIRLRVMEMKDAEDLWEIFSNDASTRYWLGHCETLEETEKMMRVEYLSYRQRGLMPPYVIVKDEKVIGICCFNDALDDIGRIGFILNEKYEHQGLMQEALKNLLEEGFCEYRRIEALCMKENEKSQRCLKRLGFQKEGVMREYVMHQNEYVDVELYSLLRKEWEHEKRIVNQV